MRDLSGSPPNAGNSVKTVAKTAMPTSSEIMKTGSVIAFTT